MPRKHPLDSDENQRLLSQLQQFRRQSRLAHQENRLQMAIDADYYDGNQLSNEQIGVLNEREQPLQEWNVIKNVVNWIVGVERKGRVDHLVLPRHPDAVKEAKTKSKVIKYVCDETRAEFIRSEAFTTAAKVGVGWLDVGAYNNPEQPIFYRAVDWRDVWFDNLGKRSDMMDWRYVFEEKWTDLDIAISLFKDRKSDLENLAQQTNSRYPFAPDDSFIFDDATDGIDQNSMVTGGSADEYRNRVRITRMQYRKPAEVKILNISGQVYGALDKTVYREGDELHDHLVKYGYAALDKAHRMTVRMAMFAGGVFLSENPTPYNHDRFTLIPVFCYRRDRDGMPYGLIRDMRSPQDDINSGKISARFLMTAKQFMAEEKAFGPQGMELFREEMQRPDGIGLLANGGLALVKPVDHRADIQAHLASASDGERFIHNISGITPELQGQSQRDLSGKAINALQNQGSTASGGILFDNYYDSLQQAGDILTACIEQFFNSEKIIRITGEKNRPEFVKINSVDEEGNPVDSITASKSDFRIGKTDYRESIRQQMLDTMGNLIMTLAKTGGKGGDIAIALIDLYVDLCDDLPNKEEAVARVRKITGQQGADEELTDQQKQEKQAQIQAVQKQMQESQAIQKAMIQLEMRLKEAEAVGREAKAGRDKTESMAKALDSFIKAMQASAGVALRPELVEAADHLLEEAKHILGDGAPQAPEPQPQQVQETPQGGM